MLKIYFKFYNTFFSILCFYANNIYFILIKHLNYYYYIPLFHLNFLINLNFLNYLKYFYFFFFCKKFYVYGKFYRIMKSKRSLLFFFFSFNHLICKYFISCKFFIFRKRRIILFTYNYFYFFQYINLIKYIKYLNYYTRRGIYIG